MRHFTFLFIISLFFCCKDNLKQKINIPVKKGLKEELKLFAPNSEYYTTIKSEYDPYNGSPIFTEENLEWKQKNYQIFQKQILDSLNHKNFELISVFGNDDSIVLFNEFVEEKNRTKHIILDTLYNYSNFAKDNKNKGTSLGIMDKADLIGIDVSKIKKESIISVIETLDNRPVEDKIQDAIKESKKKGNDPFEEIKVRNTSKVLKAWFANTKTRKIEPLEVKSKIIKTLN
jgi:hypothetical protein